MRAERHPEGASDGATAQMRLQCLALGGSLPLPARDEGEGYDSVVGDIPIDLYMTIQDLRVTNVGPFGDIAFEFDEHINVFVGPNSSGKSTTLMTLASIVTYPFELPGRLRRKAPAAFTMHFV